MGVRCVCVCVCAKRTVEGLRGLKATAERQKVAADTKYASIQVHRSCVCVYMCVSSCTWLYISALLVCTPLTGTGSMLYHFLSYL